MELAELVDGRLADVTEPPRLVDHRGLEEVADEPSVAEALPAFLRGERASYRGDAVVVGLEVIALRHPLEDRPELIVAIVVELEREAEAALETGIRLDEPAHGAGIARDDDHEIVAVILHLLHEGADGFVAE